jgi:hypothetical protein
MQLMPTRVTITDHITGRNEKVMLFILISATFFIVSRTLPHRFHTDPEVDWEPRNIAELYRKLSSPRTQADVDQMRALMSRKITVDPHGAKGHH